MNPAEPKTKEQVKAALLAVQAVAEALRELKSVPSGHFYAHVSGAMSFETYNGVINTLKRTGLVTETNHVLSWAGPELEAEPKSNEVVCKFNTRADAEFWFKQERRGGNFSSIDMMNAPDEDGNWIVRVVRPAKKGTK